VWFDGVENNIPFYFMYRLFDSSVPLIIVIQF